jgi:zinc ribbon protein
MTQTGHRFCPRCGTALVADMAFCPRCGLNSAEVAQGQEPAASPMDAATGAPAPAPVEAVPAVAAASSVRSFADRGPHISGIVIAGLLIMVGLIGFGLLTRPSGSPAPGVGTGGAGGQVQPGSTAAAAPSAPIVGLTILSPSDGQAVATKDVNVIGLAPPGVSVTQDISFGLDQHATADGTGHWTIKVGLKDGENKLVFRIGDDASTRKELRVTYTPPAP